MCTTNGITFRAPPCICNITIGLSFKENSGSNTAGGVYFLKIDLLHKIIFQIRKKEKKKKEQKT